MGFQLTLGLKLSPKKTLENFIGLNNQRLVKTLIDHIDNRKQGLFYLYGDKFSGKSHLLQASCHRLVYQGLQAGYIDLHNIDDLKILSGLEQLRLICFDNWDGDKQMPSQKEFFKSFITKMLIKHHTVILSSSNKHQESFFKDFEEDFHSHHLSHLQKEEMPKALQLKLNERGLHLSEVMQKLILNKASNTVKSLEEILDAVECSQDSEKRKFSSAFLKKILEDF